MGRNIGELGKHVSELCAGGSYVLMEKHQIYVPGKGDWDSLPNTEKKGTVII